MKKMSVVRLTAETKERPEELERYCVEHLEDCSADIFSFGDFDEKALQRAKDEKPEGIIRSMGDYNVVIAFVIEIFEMNEDGEFSEDSDYDW